MNTKVVETDESASSGSPSRQLCQVEATELLLMLFATCTCFTFGVALCFVGCKEADKAKPSNGENAVQKIESAGFSANNLSYSNVNDLLLWFGKRADVARSVALQCRAETIDDEAYSSSDEGRICLAARLDSYGYVRH